MISYHTICTENMGFRRSNTLKEKEEKGIRHMGLFVMMTRFRQLKKNKGLGRKLDSLLQTGQLAMDKALDISKPQFSHLPYGDGNWSSNDLTLY